MALASIAALRAALSYNQETGALTWVTPTSNRVRPGDPAGAINKHGYYRLGFGNRDYQAHRIAWALHYGAWPVGVVDHIDGNPSNNRISNLRDVSIQINMQNRRAATRGSLSGLLGAHLHRQSGLWHAVIKTSGKATSLGYHKTPEAAHAAYVEAKRLLHAGNTL
jgi:HNH endonuclease